MVHEAKVHDARGMRYADPYVLVALAALVLLTIQTLNRQWSSDFWIHHATLDALRRDLLHPQHPLTGTNDPSEYFSPYSLALAAFARVTGLPSVSVMQIAGIGNLLMFLAAFRLFVVELTGRRLAAVFALIATFVAWGIDPWRWSGFLNLNSIGFGLPYASMFASAVGLFVAWAFLRYARTNSTPWLAFVSVGYATVVLSHPFTGAWVAVVLVGVAIQERIVGRRAGMLLIATGIACVLIALWPYYSAFDLLTAGDTYSSTHDPLYRRTALRLVATLPGFVVVVARFRGNHRDALALMAGGGVAIYAFGAVTGESNFGRVLPLVVLPAHIGWGLLIDSIVRGRQRRPWIVSVAAGALVVGVVGIAAGLPRMVPSELLPASLRDDDALKPITEPYDGLDDALPLGTVVVTETRRLAQVAPSYGLAVVEPAWATAFVGDVGERHDVAGEILRGDLRRQARYRVGAVLCATDACVARFRHGSVAASGPSWTLIRLPTVDN